MLDFNETFSELLTKLDGWIDALILMLPNFVAAAFVATLAWFAAQLMRKAMLGLMHRLSNHVQVNRLIASAAYMAVLLTGIFVALGILNLDKTVTSLLAGVGIIGLALGFAFQDMAANFISGVMLSLRRPFNEGDIIQTRDFQGLVESVDLRATTLRTFQGQLVILPNKDVFQNAITNFSRAGWRRIDLKVGVSYGDDLEKVRRVALEAVHQVSGVERSRPVDLYYEGFGDSSIDFVVRFWTSFHKQTDYLQARSDAVMHLKKAFDAEGITIPFPIRTLDFGIVGGEKLSEVLPQRFYDAPANGRG